MLEEYQNGGTLPVNHNGVPYLFLKYCIMRKRMGTPIVTKEQFEKFRGGQEVGRKNWSHIVNKLQKLDFIVGSPRTGYTVTEKGIGYPFVVAAQLRVSNWTKRQNKKWQENDDV